MGMNPPVPGRGGGGSGANDIRTGATAAWTALPPSRRTPAPASAVAGCPAATTPFMQPILRGRRPHSFLPRAQLRRHALVQLAAGAVEVPQQLELLVAVAPHHLVAELGQRAIEPLGLAPELGGELHEHAPAVTRIRNAPGIAGPLEAIDHRRDGSGGQPRLPGELPGGRPGPTPGRRTWRASTCSPTPSA